MVPAELTIITRAGRPTLFLDVTYDGTRPPKALFDDLRMIGFDPPTEMPPPSSAMDWSTPDPITGRPYSVRPHVVQAAIEPPQGTGPKRSWTESERHAYQTSLDGVLRRHGITSWELGRPVEIPDPSAPATPPPSAPAPPVAVAVVPVGAGDREADADVTGFVALTAPPVPTPVSTPGPAEAGEAPAPDRATDWQHVVITSIGADLGDVHRALQGAGMAGRLVRIEREVVQRFRGSEQIIRRAVPAVELIVDGRQLGVLVPTLVSNGIDETLLVIDVSAATPADLNGFLAPSGSASAAPTAPGATVADGRTTIVAVVDPRCSTTILQALDDAGALDRTIGSGTRNVTSHFRGAEHVTSAPATRIEVHVEPSAVGPIVALLTRLGRVDSSDERQLRVIPSGGVENEAIDRDAPSAGGAPGPPEATGPDTPMPSRKRSRLRLVG